MDHTAVSYPGDPDAQYGKATALLKKYRRQNLKVELDIARRFVLTALASGWEIALQKRFSEVATFLGYQDYFLSYTNMRSDEINYTFRDAFYGETKTYFRKYGSKTNLLARQIVVHLSGLSGFYDKDKILGGDEIRAELEAGARSALVFIQIISKGLLDPERDEATNWCFREYCYYGSDEEATPSVARSRKRKYRFLVAEQRGRELREPARAIEPLSEVRDAYKPWFDQMLRLDVDVLECARPDALKYQIERIGREISLFRNSVLDDIVPDEFAAT